MKIKTMKPITAFMLMATLLFGSFVMMHAQDELTAAEAAEVHVPETSLLDKFNQGGLAMYVLAIFSVAAIGLIIFNFINLRKDHFLQPDLVDQVNNQLLSGNVDGAKSICQEANSPVTNIIEAGLDKYDAWNPDLALIDKSMEEASNEELSSPFVFINYLSVVGSLAPMVGLLGTVSGMVKAFDVIGREGTGNPQMLAGNISEALITTASGMIVGIPAMFFYFYFKNRYGKLVSKITRILGNTSFSLRTALYSGHSAEGEYQE